MSTLLLFNPDDMPYGNLSPLADHIVSKSYAALIKSEFLRKTVEMTKTHDARKESLAYFNAIQDENYKTFLKEGLDVKYKEGSLALDSLLQIQEDRLVYVSTNLFLGMNEGKGFNFVGDYLNGIRKQAREQLQKKTIQATKDRLNKIFAVFTVLRDEISTGANDLKSYVGKGSIDDIIEQRLFENKPVHIIDTKQDIPESIFFYYFPESIPSIFKST